MKSIFSNASGFIPASHEDPRNPGVLKRVIATKHDFQEGHVQMLNWARLPAGSSFQLHYHEGDQISQVIPVFHHWITFIVKRNKIASWEASVKVMSKARSWTYM